MTRAQGDFVNPDNIRQGNPLNASTFAESISRLLADTDVAIAATGVALAVGVPLQSGDVVTNVSYIVGATAAGTPTNQFVGLYSPAGVLLGQSADGTNTARAANTAYTVPLASPATITVAGLYYVSLSFTATTVPTLRGHSLLNAVVAGALGLGQKILVQSHGSGLTSTAPATIATPTTTFAIPYVVCT